MGFFSSGPKPGTPEAPKATHDGAYIAPDRSKRAHCWEARDIYFGCLTKNNIIDSIKEKDNADRLCSKESQQFDKDCATSWVTYFKKRRVMEHQRELTLKKLHAEGAQGLEAARLAKRLQMYYIYVMTRRQEQEGAFSVDSVDARKLYKWRSPSRNILDPQPNTYKCIREAGNRVMLWRCVFPHNSLMRRPLHQVVSLGSKSWFATPRFPITTSATTGARQTIASIIASQGSKYGPEDSIKVNGNVRTVRKSKKVAFAEVSDGSTSQSLQVVFEDPMQVSRLSTGCAVELAGHITPSPPGLEQQYELKANDVKVIGEADRQTYPLQKKYHSPDFLRSIPHMRIRTQFNSYLSRLRSESIYQLTQFFHNHPKGTYIQVQPPIITSSDCEGAGEVFTVSGNENEPVQDHGKDAQELFFRSPKYLTVSSQLHLEAYAAELGRVWTLSPTFRAEESDTPRHLAEFYMLEVEALHTRTLNDLMTLTEDMIRHLTVSLANSSMLSELKIARKKADPKGEHETISWEALQSRWMGLEAKDWPRINYTDAINILSKATASGQVTFKHQPTWAEGLALEHEKYIAKVVGSGSPVFVTDYPKKIKPFYMLPSLSSNDATSSGGNHPDTSTVACFDLLLPELAETVGGSLREHRLENLISSMRSHGLLRQTPAEKIPVDSESSYPYLRPDEDIGSMRWYADLRRWGSVPHGGFGLGFDRLLAYLSGVGSLRDVVPFPRFYGRCDC